MIDENYQPSSTQMHVFRVLKEHQHADNTVTIGIRRLARETNLNERTVMRALARLKELGFIAVQKRMSSTGRLANKYTLLRDVPTPREDAPLFTESPVSRDSIHKLLKPRQPDGYLNATLMCQAYGKHLGHWLSNQSTYNLVNALSTDIGIPTSLLVQVTKGGDTVRNPIQQGTWIHPDLAVQLAQWLDPTFALFVSRLVRSFFASDNADASLNGEPTPKINDVKYINAEPHTATPPNQPESLMQQVVSFMATVEKHRAIEAEHLQTMCLEILKGLPA